jgi:hypothetical protein
VTSWPPMLDDFRHSNRKLIVRSIKTAGLGGVAKLFGLINQIVSVTLISSAMGAEGLREQMLAIASVSWFNLTLCGMHSALPALLIRSDNNHRAFASLAKTAYLLAVIGAFGAAGLTLLILNLGWIRGLSSAPVATAAICNAAVIALGLSEKVFQATDRIAQFNILNIVGTAISLATTVVLARTHGTAANFVVAYYLSLFLPFLVATFMVAPRLNLAVRPALDEFIGRARQLVGVGLFGFGYEMAAYCRLLAPLTLLSALGLSNEIASIGLGLRLVGLAGGGLTIVIPILFLQIGAAIHVGDQDARRSWTRLGIASAAVTAVAAAGLFLVFGQIVYQVWTAGTVTLDRSEQIALAAFSGLSLAHDLLFPLAAPDPAIAKRLRWLFWLEGPAILVTGTAGALLVPATYGGVAMLGGATFVMGVTVLVLVLVVTRQAVGGSHRTNQQQCTNHPI